MGWHKISDLIFCKRFPVEIGKNCNKSGCSSSPLSETKLFSFDEMYLRNTGLKLLMALSMSSSFVPNSVGFFNPRRIETLLSNFSKKFRLQHIAFHVSSDGIDPDGRYCFTFLFFSSI